MIHIHLYVLFPASSLGMRLLKYMSKNNITFLGNFLSNFF